MATPYRNAPNSGIVSFTSNRAGDPDKWLEATFHNGQPYRYVVGQDITLAQLTDMKELASIAGQGLCRYITRNRIGR